MPHSPDSASTSHVNRFPAGTNVLIVGPPMVGKFDLLVRLLAADYQDTTGLVFVSTDGTGGEFVDELGRQAPSIDHRSIGLVTCAESTDQPATEAIIRSVSSPSDLTGMSIATTKLQDQLTGRGNTTVRHGFSSISTLLMYIDPEDVFKFIHVYTQRITATEGVGIFSMNDAAHSTQVVNMIMSEFDHVFELTEADAPEHEQ